VRASGRCRRFAGEMNRGVHDGLLHGERFYNDKYNTASTYSGGVRGGSG